VTQNVPPSASSPLRDQVLKKITPDENRFWGFSKSVNGEFSRFVKNKQRHLTLVLDSVEVTDDTFGNVGPVVSKMTSSFPKLVSFAASTNHIY
jgi:hypothetical protein